MSNSANKHVKMVQKWQKLSQMPSIRQYSTVFYFEKGIRFACNTNRLTRFDPIRLTNTETTVKFFSIFFQLNNLPKLTL